MLESFLPLFNSAANRMVKEIATRHSDGFPFNIYQHLEKCVIELVCAATFDVHLANENNGEDLAHKIAETANM